MKTPLKKLLPAVLFAVAAAASAAPGAPWEMFDRRVGMFVHWGVYAVDGYHEQQRLRQGLSRAEYATRAAGFTAERFDAEALVRAAESLGAEYIVLTAKHHDGFCLWDTQTTDFNAVKSPAKRDVVREVADACRRRGMKFGLYYSNPDWNNPNAYNPLSTHQMPPEAGDRPDLAAYRAYVKAQLGELLTRYGEIVCLFWDIPTHVADPEMNALVRRLQPGIKIDDRGWGAGGDYATPERGLPPGAAFTRPTEACDSVGARSWGYRANEDYRTAGYCADALDAALARGGNFLLNVGPRADGTLPDEVRALLAATGAWYRRVKESYRGVTTEPWLVTGERARVTRRGDTVYVHLPAGLGQGGLDLAPLDALPVRATVLNDGSAVACELAAMPGRWEDGRRTLHLAGLDAAKFAGEPVVVRLDFPAGSGGKGALALDRGDGVRAVLDRYVGAGRVAGVVSAVSDRSGKVRFDCVGWADLERRVPMATNTLFAVFSMTKTVNGAAIMAAIDDGAMALDDPVAKFLPEFADVKVRATNAEGRVELVPPKRPLTIRDLVTHTSGSRFGAGIVKRALPLREVARQMAATPLVAQPGETFSYGNAWVDASAAALEVAVGMPYENWLRARILGPLGMHDTTFTPTPEQVARLVKAYNSDDTPLRPAADMCAKQLVFPWTEKVYPAASAGLFSTPADMLRFSQMLAAHGAWQGRQIISRRTFDAVFAAKETPPGIAEPYCVGAWLYGDWLGHEGAMRTDQRANLREGLCRLFFIQTENRAGSAFFSLKREWNAACDAMQLTPPFDPAH